MTEPRIPRFTMPDGLRERVQAAVQRAALTGNAAASDTRAQAASDGPRAARRVTAPAWIALAASLVVAVSAGVLTTAGRARRVDDEVVQLADAHLRALVPGHLADVASTDRHTVKPWFAGRINFAPPVSDPAAEGYPLVGGRVDVLNGQTVAALVYSRHGHLVNVFIRPTRGEEHDVAFTAARRGYNIIAWSNDGMRFWAISDLESRQLEALHALLALPDRVRDTLPAGSPGR